MSHTTTSQNAHTPLPWGNPFPAVRERDTGMWICSVTYRGCTIGTFSGNTEQEALDNAAIVVKLVNKHGEAR